MNSMLKYAKNKKLNIVSDQTGTPTSARLIAEVTNLLFMLGLSQVCIT